MSSLQVAELAVRPAVRASGDTGSERPARLGLIDAARPLGCVPAATAVDVHRRAVPVEAEFEQTLGSRRSPLLALPLFRLALFFVESNAVTSQGA